ERLAVVVLHEPVRMLLKDVRAGFGDERRHPDRWFEALLANRLQYVLHAAAERAARLEPIAHRGLVAVVKLYVLKLGRILLDCGEVVHHVLRGGTRAKRITTAP